MHQTRIGSTNEPIPSVQRLFVDSSRRTANQSVRVRAFAAGLAAELAAELDTGLPTGVAVEASAGLATACASALATALASLCAAACASAVIRFSLRGSTGCSGFERGRTARGARNVFIARQGSRDTRASRRTT